MWKRNTATVLTLMTLLGITGSAMAHPSDFRTLTVDLIWGSRGLEKIDAAVVRATGPSYHPFPSVELRQRVADDVLQALDLSGSQVAIDAELSERYHEVGFTISFAAPRPGQTGTLEFDTSRLQTIVTNTGLDVLKLSVCVSDPNLLSKRVVDATRSGRDPDSSERANCRIWEVDDEEPPVSFTVRSPSLPMTGFRPTPGVVAGLTLLAVGCVILSGLRSRHGRFRHRTLPWARRSHTDHDCLASRSPGDT